METHGSEVYSSHLESLSKTYTRKGVTGLVTPEELDVAGRLETVLRVSEPTEGVLSDLGSKAFISDGFDELRKKYFQEYLEYRKLYLEVSLEDYLGTRFGIDVLDEPSKDTMVDTYDDEVYPEDLYEEDNNASVVLYTLPFGVDSDGYDIWSDPNHEKHEAEMLDKIEQFKSIKLPDMDLITEPEEEIVEVPEVFKSGLSYLPSGVDEAGYDIWKNTQREPIGVDEFGYDVWSEQEEEIFLDIDVVEETTEVEKEQQVNGTWYGIDSLGYDIWYQDTPEPEFTYSAIEDEEDGFDHTEDAERDHLGELNSKWLGSDSDGYDLWHTGENVEPGIADNPLGELKTSPHGTDSDGYDIWKSPVVQKPSKDSPSGVSQSTESFSSEQTGIPSDRIIFTDRGSGAELHRHAPLSKEDQLLDNVDKVITRVFGFGRKIATSRTKRNKV